MKTAICVSGICRGNVSENIQLLKDKFPNSDVFFASWKNQEKSLIENGISEFFIFDEPIINYHPIKDILDEEIKSPKLKIQKYKECNNKKFYEKTLHHTKQILIHSMLLEKIDDSYDMIIRSRFDTVLSKKVSFDKYVNLSYDNNIAIGFGTRTTRHPDFNIIQEIPKIYPDGTDPAVSQDWGWYLMDPLILHPKKIWDFERVKYLHSNKKLKAAEWGWYQILSEPYNSNHLSVYGGAQIEKYLK